MISPGRLVISASEQLTELASAQLTQNQNTTLALRLGFAPFPLMIPLQDQGLQKHLGQALAANRDARASRKRAVRMDQKTYGPTKSGTLKRKPPEPAGTLTPEVLLH